MSGIAFVAVIVAAGPLLVVAVVKATGRALLIAADRVRCPALVALTRPLVTAFVIIAVGTAARPAARPIVLASLGTTIPSRRPRRPTLLTVVAPVTVVVAAATRAAVIWPGIEVR